MDTLIDVQDLKTYFFLDEGVVKAVDGASFKIRSGRTLGVVGESGCGKSVTAQSILRIVPEPGRIVSGQILFHPDLASNPDQIIDLVKLKEDGDEIREIRGARISMIFQEPMATFSPMHTVGHQIEEAILLHQKVNKTQARAAAIDVLDSVGIPNAKQRVDEYPFRLSGGMLQRAMIAMALSCHPSLLIADEPTTALDVTIQAQILELLRQTQQKLGMAIMVITHDLGVIAELAEDVIVMYWGRIVEEGTVNHIFHTPKHPYTIGLHRSIPRLGATQKDRLTSIKGIVPDPFAVLPGCPFYPRCEARISGTCNAGGSPPLVEVEPGHRVACHSFLNLRESNHA